MGYVQLTTQQKLDFYENGFLIIPGAVSPFLVNAALHTINYSLGEEGMNKNDLPTLRAQSYCKEMRNAPAVTDLANKSAMIPVIESLVGKDNLIPVESGQIALRFPHLPGADLNPPSGHLDGLGSGLNGSAKGTYRRGFTGLAVILLSPLSDIYSGNFTVWPKSHTFFENFFRENGVEVLENGMPKVDLPEPPLQITGNAGDLVVVHHQVIHTAAPNHSPNIRYAAIFRLRHQQTSSLGNQAYTDIWREWPGIQETISATGQ